jgi:hypothetical protein
MLRSRLVFPLGLMVSGCDGCAARPSAAPPASSATAPASAAASAKAPSRAIAPASDRGLTEIKVGSATVSGKSEDVPTDAAPGFRHAMSFAVHVALANPGQSLTFEVVDRVASEADADAERRILELTTTAGKETLDGTLSFFSGDASSPERSPPRRIRLSVGSQRVEVDVPARSLPSRRCRSSATSMRNPLLYPRRWASLLFFAQAQDDRGLEARMVEPPQMLLDGKTHSYPDWPEPGLLWRIRANGL